MKKQPLNSGRWESRRITRARRSHALFEALDRRVLFAAGIFDSAFGLSGREVFQLRDTAEINGVAVLGNNQIITLGSGSDSGGADIELQKLNTDGSFDTSFGGGTGRVLFHNGNFDFATGLAVQNDGSIVAVGATNGAFLIARRNPDGSADTSFGEGGIDTISFGAQGFGQANAVAIQGDGKIVVVGQYSGSNSSDFAIARLNPDGSFDSGFGSNGEVTVDFAGLQDQANAVAIRGDGSIVIGGSAQNANGDADFAFLGLRPDGSLDSSFGNNGTVTINATPGDSVNGIAMDPSNGNIYFDGATSTGGYFGALNSNGSPIGTIGGAQASVNRYTALMRASDGSLYAAGQANQTMMVTKFLPTGATAPGFGTSGNVLAPFARASGANGVAVSTDGSVVIGGFAGIGDMAVARILPSGGLDTGFGLPGRQLVLASSVNGSDNASAIAFSGSKIIVGGSYGKNDNNGDEFGVLQFNSDGTLDTNFASGGAFTFQGTGFDSISAIAVQSDGKIIAAGSSSGDTSDYIVFRLNADGSLDSSFGTNGMATIHFGGNSADFAEGVLIQPDGKIVVGGTTSVNSQTTGQDFGLARLNSNGSLDSSFGTGGLVVTDIGGGQSDHLRGIALAGTQIVAVGDTLSNGSPEFALVKYNSNGQIDTTFSGGGIITQVVGNLDEPAGVSVQSDGKIVVAGIASTGQSTSAALLRYEHRWLAGHEFRWNRHRDAVHEHAIGGGFSGARQRWKDLSRWIELRHGAPQYRWLGRYDLRHKRIDDQGVQRSCAQLQRRAGDGD